MRSVTGIMEGDYTKSMDEEIKESLGQRKQQQGRVTNK